MPKLTIIVPVYFNEANLPTTIPALQRVLDGLSGMEGELVFVDDGSTDGSSALLREYARVDARIKFIRLAKNYGAYTALLAGLDHATGDCLVFIMADLQDPPELIPSMVTAWKQGSKIVVAARTDREEGFIQRMFATTFWGFMRRFAVSNVPIGGFDFVLFDRVIRDTLVNVREKNSHIMIQVLLTGFMPVVIPYVRRRRTVGTSRWTLAKKIKLFVDSVFAFSYIPVRIMTMIGLVTACVGFTSAIYILVERLRTGYPVQGWTSLMIVVLLLSGIQMLMLGVIGEYLWRISDETRRRPNYTIAEKVNL